MTDALVVVCMWNDLSQTEFATYQPIKKISDSNMKQNCIWKRKNDTSLISLHKIAASPLACLCMEWNHEWQCSVEYNTWLFSCICFGIFELNYSFYKYIYEIVKNIVNNLWDMYNEMGRTLKTISHQ